MSQNALQKPDLSLVSRVNSWEAESCECLLEFDLHINTRRVQTILVLSCHQSLCSPSLSWNGLFHILYLVIVQVYCLLWVTDYHVRVFLVSVYERRSPNHTLCQILTFITVTVWVLCFLHVRLIFFIPFCFFFLHFGILFKMWSYIYFLWIIF